MTANQSARPSGKLYGVTHSPDGTPRIVEPKTVKVGIGLAKGKALHVYIDLEKNWVIQIGSGTQTTRERHDNKAKAQLRYRELHKTAPVRQYPERLPYFTFSHLSSSGDFEPDWDIIESHGTIPTEIDVIFVRDDPFTASYQLWSTTEKKCDGDGKIALRINSLAETPAEKAMAAETEKRGEKYFPIVNGCWLGGCKYARPTNDKPAPCRPMGRLLFQLLNSPRLGATAVFNTAGYKSISQLFSSIEIFKRATGRGDPEKGFVSGIPLKMVLRPYRVQHDGRTATQYAVSLEYRAESAIALQRSLVEQAVQYRIAGAEPLKQLEGMTVPELPAAAQEIEEENPAAIAAEFDPVPAGDQVIHEDPEDPEIDGSGAGGPLEHAWDPELSADPIQPVSTCINPTQPGPRADSEEVRKFYDLCRRRGMTDATIAEQLGRHGFESQQEITTTALPDLVAWADSYRPAGQGSLL